VSFLKYFDDQGERGIARTADGYPIRGNRVPFLKQHEYENIPVGFDAHVNVFCTSDEEHMRAYQIVLDRIANGLYTRLAPDKEEFVAERGHWLILCRWAEMKGELSPQVVSGAGGYMR
jgi:hypothetical protein